MHADDGEANHKRKKERESEVHDAGLAGIPRKMRADKMTKKMRRRREETTENADQIIAPESIFQGRCLADTKSEFFLEEKRRRKKNKEIGDDHEQEAQNSKHDKKNKRQKFLWVEKRELCNERKRRKQKWKGLGGGDAQEEEVARNESKHNEKSDKQKSERIVLEGSKTQNCTSSSRYTVSIAIAVSVVNNAQSLLLATMLVGQIARAAVIFRVDEIIVFDDNGTNTVTLDGKICQDIDAQEKCGSFMVRILQYMEVPQYLRRALIPVHNNLKLAGMLPPLDAPHHLRKHEWLPFREGVVVGKRSPTLSGSYVDVGLDKEVLVDRSLQPGTRVTVNMGSMKCETVLTIVGREAVQEAGIYWGYKVRYASCLSAVFEECPFEGKYDYCIGTSEHGEKIGLCEFSIPKFRHLLIAFGGLGGLEESMELDHTLRARNVRSLFHRYVNTCPNQGSRTIRTEEAILISLEYLQTAIQRRCF